MGKKSLGVILVSRRTCIVLAIVLALNLAVLSGCGKRSEPAQTKPVRGSQAPEDAAKLPSLDQVKCVSGRAATLEDIKSGAAAFVQQKGGIGVGTPYKITIPQYAIHTDENGKQAPGIIVQAEHSADLDRDMFGMLTADGTHSVDFRESFTLLGEKRPD